MASSNESDREQRDEYDVPEDSKQPSKKTKRVGGTRRRTKTGCLTCRQRRVKCDEQKPTCRNCDKSRRQCAGYQPPTPRTPSNIANIPFEHYQYPPPSLPSDSSGIFGFPINQTEAYLDYFPPHGMSAHPVHHVHNTEDWVLNGNYSTSIAGQWSPSQESWHSNMTNSQHFPHENLGDVMPAHHMSQFVAYNGRHAPQPDGVEQIVAGSAGSTNARRETYARYTDLLKSSSRAHASSTDRATSSQRGVNDGAEACLLNRSKGPQNQQNFIAGPFSQGHTSSQLLSGQNDSEHSSQYTLTSLRTSSNLALDERMAYLLSHFCNYLRPCISIWERPLRHDGTSTLAEKIPKAALTHKGLLHSIMAVSALHLAILHRTSEVVPLKHFVLASRKLPQLLGSPVTRFKLETLSQCLLLAFYSVVLGDHAKWVLHLRGCSAFLMEHDFAGFHRAVRKVRCQQQKEGIPSALRSDEDWELDEKLIRNLTGLEVDYSNQTQAIISKEADWTTLSESDIEEWKTKGDLLAWYLKMDVFQSALSGDPLLLPWQNWKFFAPRGRIGLEDKLYATMDHLWLVLGRLANFGANDRPRKQRKLSLNGGQWQPEPGFLGPPPTRSHNQQNLEERPVPPSPAAPSANEGRTRKPRPEHASATEKRKPPLFFGMMPPPSIPPSMLSSFHVMDAELRKHSQDEKRSAVEKDIVEETEGALVEHQAIADALELWKDSIHGCFSPLPVNSRMTETPFSPEIRFSDPTHACLWAFYHLGKILLRRYHPHSPPAMMVSSVVNAHITQKDATMIGRIFYGLLRTQAELAGAGSINPTLVAALQEMTFPLMFAGVQYNSDIERKFVIESLVDIGNDSGWKSAFSVASALEKSWAAHGSYQPTLKSSTPSEAARYDVGICSSGILPSTPTQQHESRFDSHDRRFIDRFSDLRAYWAIGVLSTPDDIGKVLGNLKLHSDS